MATGDNPPELYTIGHGSRSFAEVQQHLESHHVRTIIDVRSTPYSAHAPDFSREALAEACSIAGMGYRWFGDHLGGRPSDPGLRNERGATDWARLAAQPGFQGSLAEVARLARDGGVVLLCAEVDPDRCHRSFLLAPEMERRGFAVRHILSDGSWRAHQPDLFGDD